MTNDEITFRKASVVAGLAYNTLRSRRYQGTLPFPVYERSLTPGARPKLYCRVSDIEAWKDKTTVRVAAGVAQK